jgi:hypothetical protein
MMHCLHRLIIGVRQTCFGAGGFIVMVRELVGIEMEPGAWFLGCEYCHGSLWEREWGISAVPQDLGAPPRKNYRT